MTRLLRRAGVSILATIVPYSVASRGASQQTKRTATRVPAPRGLLLAWQLATHRPAELPAGYRGGFRQSRRRGEADGIGVRVRWREEGGRRRESLSDFVLRLGICLRIS